MHGKAAGRQGKGMDMCVYKLREPNTDNTETKAMTTPRQHSTQTTETAMATQRGPVRFLQQEDTY